MPQCKCFAQVGATCCYVHRDLEAQLAPPEKKPTKEEKKPAKPIVKPTQPQIPKIELTRLELQTMKDYASDIARYLQDQGGNIQGIRRHGHAENTLEHLFFGEYMDDFWDDSNENTKNEEAALQVMITTLRFYLITKRGKVGSSKSSTPELDNAKTLDDILDKLKDYVC